MEKNILDGVLNSFNEKIEDVLDKLNNRWNNRDSIDIFELALDVLYFRNTEIFNSVIILLQKNQINSAELLFRPFFEGVIKFEWCLIDTKTRALRFRRTTIENMVFLLESGYLKKERYDLTSYKASLDYLRQNGYKKLPNLRQMLSEVNTFNKDYSYSFYSHLSQITHGVFENWGDFLDFNDDFRLQKSELLFSSRLYTCFAITLFLQMRNIICFSKFDVYMFIDEINTLEEYYTFNVSPVLKYLDL